MLKRLQFVFCPVVVGSTWSACMCTPISQFDMCYVKYGGHASYENWAVVSKKGRATFQHDLPGAANVTFSSLTHLLHYLLWDGFQQKGFCRGGTKENVVRWTALMHVDCLPSLYSVLCFLWFQWIDEFVCTKDPHIALWTQSRISWWDCLSAHRRRIPAWPHKVSVSLLVRHHDPLSLRLLYRWPQ